ncbi:LysR family transcriptional regulator [Lolliginicoccus suaedae]|uniref:LysR family transcriptional regulator n=1 Tax=Lolliginicoccus suaedae TaxID=2605429 RepID=UPI0011EF33AD|nr:LysR family transcriptional regulator [Lolliginicoccus suaedae]
MVVNRQPLDLRRLQQFLAVADAAGFTRAAQELHLSQQALSSSIARLEAELGVALFDRTTRQVQLTKAGRALYDGAEVLLAAADHLVRQARDAPAPSLRPFVIGHTPAVTPAEVHGLLEPVLAALPELPITVTQMYPGSFHQALLEGRIDAALRRGVAVPQNLAAATIAYTPARIAVRATHRLAACRSIAVSDLRGERIIVWGPPGASFYTDFILSTCRRAGFEPTITVNRVQGTPPASAVLDNEGIAFVTDPPGPVMDDQAIVIDLADPPLVPVQMLWLPNTVSAARDLLVTQSQGQ